MIYKNQILTGKHWKVLLLHVLGYQQRLLQNSQIYNVSFVSEKYFGVVWDHEQ